MSDSLCSIQQYHCTRCMGGVYDFLNRVYNAGCIGNMDECYQLCSFTQFAVKVLHVE